MAGKETRLLISTKASKTENRFETGFQQPKTGLPRKPVLTSLILSAACREHGNDETGPDTTQPSDKYFAKLRRDQKRRFKAKTSGNFFRLVHRSGNGRVGLEHLRNTRIPRIGWRFQTVVSQGFQPNTSFDG